MIHIKKFYYILKYGTYNEWKQMLKDYKNYKSKNQFYLQWLIIIFDRMCVKILTENENLGWLQEILNMLSKINNINDFVQFLKYINDIDIFKNLKDKVEITYFIDMYFDICIKYIKESGNYEAKR